MFADVTLAEKELQNKNVSIDFRAHALGIRAVNSIHTNRKMLTDILRSDGKVQHSPIDSDIECIHRYREKLTASTKSERC